MCIVLASASPRRKELLKQIGLEFEIKVSNVEEVITETVPCNVVMQLAKQKAMAVYAELAKDEPVMVIGSDTVVVLDGEILGKPGCEEEAIRMLTKLQGRSHEVYTGVMLVGRDDCGKEFGKNFYERTEVFFSAMSEEEIREYAATGDCLDKAGAYGIQGFCARYITGINGDYYNVMGLPVGRLYQEAKELIKG